MINFLKKLKQILKINLNWILGFIGLFLWCP